MEIEYTSRFKRSFKKLDQQLQSTAWGKLDLFKQDYNNPRLKTHKLKNTEYYAFSVTYKVRVIFLITNQTIVLVNIDDHSVYQKL